MTQDKSPHLSLPDFSGLVDLIYAGAIEDSPWQSFLVAMRAHMNAMAATLIIRRKSGRSLGIVLNSGGVPKNVSAYETEYFESDPFTDLP